MKNVKGFAVASDGSMKRIAITYDEIDEKAGKIINGNVKINRMVSDYEVISAISTIESYAHEIAEGQE